MNKNYLLIGLGVVVVLIGGLAFIFRHQIKTMLTGQPQTVQTEPVVQTPQPSAPVVEKTEVDYTDSGFSPASVTIKKGQTVNFVNKSSSQMYVASNPHPIHTDYPGFDELSAGDSYSFTFDKVGTWGYHNHINPAQKGSVVVTE